MDAVMAKYSKAGDGVILKDGHTMFSQDVVKDLNRKSFLETELTQLRTELTKAQEEVERLKEVNSYVAGLKDYAIKSNAINFERAETAEAEAKKKDIIIGSLKMKLEGNEYLLDKTSKENKAAEARVKELEDLYDNLECSAHDAITKAEADSKRYREAIFTHKDTFPDEPLETDLQLWSALQVDTDKGKP